MCRITVVSVRRGAPAGAIYVGRRTPQFAGSPLANPYRIEHEVDRDVVIARYARWLDERLRAPESPQSRELNRLVRMACVGDLALACWCAPKACHADVIKARIEAARRALGES
jgi:hypothetical protein